MSSQVHYEVFRRHGSKGGWTLLDDGKATGVKVVKETNNNTTGDYLTVDSPMKLIAA